MSTQPGMGKLLMYHSGSMSPNPAFLLGVVVIATVGCIYVVIDEFNFRTIPFVLGLDVVCLFVWYKNRAKSIECYERGIIIRELRKAVRLLYTDISYVKFHATHHRLNWIYTHTEILFGVLPMKGLPVEMKITGDKKDAENIWTIAQFILQSNPCAILREPNYPFDKV